MNRIGVKAAALLVGLPLFLWACEKDLGERGSGKKVTINFTVSNGEYGEDQEILKDAGAKEAKPETVYMSLNDNYFMAVTLTPEPAEEVRATAAFATNQKIRFVAYNGVSEVGSAIYTWNGSRFIPDDEPLGVEPDNEVMYRFVAYSFFGDPLTEPDDGDVEEGISPSQDVVWGSKDQKIYNNETSRTVPILMKHKFSRVQVKVDASSIDAQVTNVSGVVIAGGKKADLTVRTGAMAASSAAGSDVTAAMTNWVSVDGGKARQSDCVVFYPSLTTITLAAVDLEIEGVPLPLTNKSVTFAQALATNTSYTVVVDVRANRWAYSNVYWDDVNKEMKFDKWATPEAIAANSSHYQGVFFKWGSLIGISPVGGTAAANVGDVAVYIPNVSARTWDDTKTISNLGGYASIKHNGTTLQTVPYTYRYSNALLDFPNYGDYIGDICNYIDGAWRIANSLDYGNGSDEYYGPSNYIDIIFSAGPSTTTDPGGKNLMGNAGVTYVSDTGTAFLPTTGYRHYLTSGVLGEVGVVGCYWTGTGYHTTSMARRIYFYSDDVHSDVADYRECATPVRCIKKLPGE
jgi:hypothetical protein